jgi:PAS domain S-box-containing protein
MNEKVNILLVDDQEAKLLSYEVILSDLGENLIKANSGREALGHLLKTDIAVVLMDVNMPELDGFELAEIIRQHPRYQKTAIIFVSAVHLTDLDRLKGYQRGAVDYVSVPIVPEILRAKVSVFADLYRKTQQLERLNRELEHRVAERTAELEMSTARLRESEERLNAILQNTSVVVYLMSADSRFIHINRCFEGLLNLKSEEVRGKSVYDVFPQEVAAAFEANNRRVVTEGVTLEFEEFVLHPDGLHTYTSIKTPLFDEGGQAHGIVGVSTDITERKRAEEGQQLLAEVSRLLTTSLSMAERLEALASLVVNTLADWCAINLLAEDGEIRLVAANHREPVKAALVYELAQYYPLNPTASIGTPQVLRAGQTALYANFLEALPEERRRDQNYRQLLEVLGSHSTVIAPLIARGQAFGSLTFVRAEAERPFDHADLVLIEELAYRAAAAVDNARLYEAERAARIEAEAAQQSLTHLAQIRERNRLAQELHDNVAQALGYLNLQITQTHEFLAVHQLDEVEVKLRELKQITNETYADIRGEIFNLRVAPAQDVNFLETLRQYLVKYERFYHLDVQLIFEADEASFDFPSEVSIALIRTIQEALMNVRRHAQVDHARIRLGQTESDWRISVEDEGRGFDPNKVMTEQSASYGVNIMRERIEGVGGRLEIESAPGQGTRITLFYPRG